MRVDRVTQATDGRALAFAEWGDPDGFPVFQLHGTPGSRFGRHPDESVYVEAGARLITYNRPGLDLGHMGDPDLVAERVGWLVHG